MFIKTRFPKEGAVGIFQCDHVITHAKDYLRSQSILIVITYKYILHSYFSIVNCCVIIFFYW